MDAVKYCELVKDFTEKMHWEMRKFGIDHYGSICYLCGKQETTLAQYFKIDSLSQSYDGITTFHKPIEIPEGCKELFYKPSVSGYNSMVVLIHGPITKIPESIILDKLRSVEELIDVSERKEKLLKRSFGKDLNNRIRDEVVRLGISIEFRHVIDGYWGLDWKHEVSPELFVQLLQSVRRQDLAIALRVNNRSMLESLPSIPKLSTIPRTIDLVLQLANVLNVKPISDEAYRVIMQLKGEI